MARRDRSSSADRVAERLAAVVPRKNPGELDDVTAAIEEQIRDGIADALLDSAGSVSTWRRGRLLTSARKAADELMERIAQSEDVGSVVDLFALVMEIDTGEPFEYVVEKEPKRPEPELLFDSNRGTTIPRDFAREINRKSVTGVSDRDYAILEAGDTAENESYWDVWASVEDNAELTGDDGVKYSLSTTDNGDVFLVPVGMVYDEGGQSDSYWVWEDPFVPVATQFGRALAMMALRDRERRWWFDEHKQKSDDGRMEWQPAIPQIWVEINVGDGELHWSFKGPQDRNRRIRVSFERVLPAEEDDVQPDVENGWEDEEGLHITQDDLAMDDGTPVTQAVKIIRYHGSVEPSSSSFHPGVWYTQSDSDQGREYFEQGIEYRRSYHLSGFTAEEEREIYDELTRRHR